MSNLPEQLPRNDFVFLAKTCDMHTGAEAVRIIEEGFPYLYGNNILQKRAHAKQHCDAYRQLLMNEPRGHKDMYGVIITKPTDPKAHIAVLFIHNEGYSTMCGHATIALGRYAVDKGYVPITYPETEVVIECPCGIVKANVLMENGKSSSVRFSSVPCFAYKLDTEVTTERFGKIKVDIAYGGAFYAFVDVSLLSMDIDHTPLSVLVEAATDITAAAKDQIPVHHPDSKDLSFIYGTILTDGKDNVENTPTKNICIFADREVDRSPTGSGVCARMAIQFARGYVVAGQTKEFKGVSDCSFKGKVLQETKCGPHDAVIVEVAGKAYYTGDHTFKIEKDDPFPTGFVLRQ